LSNTGKLSEALSKDDLAELRRKSNLRATTILLFNWLMVIVAFWLFILLPSIITFIVAALLLGGRQLGLAVLVHECAHKAFFENERTNDFVGHWLCGSVINLSVFSYREYHLRHHRHVGTDQDPDQVFVDKYPVESASLKRKIFRDISGQTGYRDTLAKFSQFTWSRCSVGVCFVVGL